VSYLFILFAC